MVLEPSCVRPCENQHKAIAVCGTTGEPVPGLRAVGWIAPDQSLPFFCQAVVFDGEVIIRCCPGALDRCTRVEVERAEGSDNVRWRQPLFFAVFKIPVVPEIAELDGYVTADAVGVTLDFPNE